MNPAGLRRHRAVVGVVQIQFPTGWSAANDARYEQVFAPVARTEGGHSDDASDRGGETNLGVSLRFLIAAGQIDANHDGFKDLDLNLDGVLDGHDVRLVTREIQHDLFEKHFYVGPGFWNLPRPIDGAMFDQAVNGGTTAAIKLLQRALNSVFRTSLGLEPLDVDGGLGRLTRRRLELAHMNRGDDSVMFEYRLAAAERYRLIASRDPSQRKYLAGWLNRAARLGSV